MASITELRQAHAKAHDAADACTDPEEHYALFKTVPNTPAQQAANEGNVS